LNHLSVPANSEIFNDSKSVIAFLQSKDQSLILNYHTERINQLNFSFQNEHSL